MTSKSIEEWLTTIDLQMYAENLLNAGYDDLVVVSSLSDADLQSIGIDKPGHRKKLLYYAARLDASHENIKDSATPLAPCSSLTCSSSTTSVAPRRVMVLTNGEVFTKGSGAVNCTRVTIRRGFTKWRATLNLFTQELGWNGSAMGSAGCRGLHVQRVWRLVLAVSSPALVALGAISVTGSPPAPGCCSVFALEVASPDALLDGDLLVVSAGGPFLVEAALASLSDVLAGSKAAQFIDSAHVLLARQEDASPHPAPSVRRLVKKSSVVPSRGIKADDIGSTAASHRNHLAAVSGASTVPRKAAPATSVVSDAKAKVGARPPSCAFLTRDSNGRLCRAVSPPRVTQESLVSKRSVSAPRVPRVASAPSLAAAAPTANPYEKGIPSTPLTPSKSGEFSAPSLAPSSPLPRPGSDANSTRVFDLVKSLKAPGISAARPTATTIAKKGSRPRSASVPTAAVPAPPTGPIPSVQDVVAPIAASAAQQATKETHAPSVFSCSLSAEPTVAGLSVTSTADAVTFSRLVNPRRQSGKLDGPHAAFHVTTVVPKRCSGPLASTPCHVTKTVHLPGKEWSSSPGGTKVLNALRVLQEDLSPHISIVSSVVEEQSQQGLSMLRVIEQHSGKNLRSMAGAISLQESAIITLHVLRGLLALYDRGVSHGAVHLGNLVRSAVAHKPNPPSDVMFRSGIVKLTSPLSAWLARREQFHDLYAEARLDLLSLASAIAELLSGCCSSSRSASVNAVRFSSNAISEEPDWGLFAGGGDNEVEDPLVLMERFDSVDNYGNIGVFAVDFVKKLSDPPGQGLGSFQRNPLRIFQALMKHPFIICASMSSNACQVVGAIATPAKMPSFCPPLDSQLNELGTSLPEHEALIGGETVKVGSPDVRNQNGHCDKENQSHEVVSPDARGSYLSPSPVKPEKLSRRAAIPPDSLINNASCDVAWDVPLKEQKPLGLPESRFIPSHFVRSESSIRPVDVNDASYLPRTYSDTRNAMRSPNFMRVCNSQCPRADSDLPAPPNQKPVIPILALAAARASSYAVGFCDNEAVPTPSARKPTYGGFFKSPEYNRRPSECAVETLSLTPRGQSHWDAQWMAEKERRLSRKLKKQVSAPSSPRFTCSNPEFSQLVQQA